MESWLNVCCVLSEKKRQHLHFEELVTAGQKWNLNLEHVPIDKLEDMTSSGKKYDVVLHKVTEVMAKARRGDEEAQQLRNSFLRFLEAQGSDCCVLDSFDSALGLLDREEIVEKLKGWECVDKTERGKDNNVEVVKPWKATIPSSASFPTKEEFCATVREGITSLPLILKTKEAHGSRKAHEMCLVVSSTFLEVDNATLDRFSFPAMAQKFVLHNGVLIKVFAVGNKCSVALRPSISNRVIMDYQTHATSCKMGIIFFDSHDVSKSDSNCFLNDDGAHLNYEIALPKEFVLDICKEIRTIFDVSLFGLDIVVNVEEKVAYIIDINYFPGYKEMADFHNVLCQHILVSTKGE
eukprot:m.24987 g.24987  ORF g.24987 m.24987 type:complete len:351 (-) comp5717_c0_seq2:42-1094(-)